MAAQGTQFREHSLFYNDVWRVSARLSLNLGVRWDKNHGVNNAGQLVSTSATFSPRLGVMWDPNGNGKLAITGGFAKYAAALANTIADSSSPAGQISTYRWNYQGPSINANSNGPLVSTEAAIQQVFDWFNANGGLNRPALSSSVPGVSTKIADSLQSPYVLEYSTGVNRQIARGTVRIDGTYRNYQNFYATVTDTTTGRVTDSLGRSFDLSLVENTDVVQREYAGVATTVTYRIGRGLDTGVSYTLSHAWGNVDAEAANGSGPSTSSVFAYPEYKNASWNNPAGDLAVDQRHRANFWATYALPFAHGVTLSAMQQAASGIPYAAVGTVNATPFVSNPGYVTPGGSGVAYYFSARDAYRTEATYRTDFAANYAFNVKASATEPTSSSRRNWSTCSTSSGVRVRRYGVQERRRRRPDVNRSVGADAVEHGGGCGVQPIHHHAGRGHELGARAELRQTAQPVRIYDTADVQAVVRGQVLVFGCGVQGAGF